MIRHWIWIKAVLGLMIFSLSEPSALAGESQVDAWDSILFPEQYDQAMEQQRLELCKNVPGLSLYDYFEKSKSGKLFRESREKVRTQLLPHVFYQSKNFSPLLGRLDFVEDRATDWHNRSLYYLGMTLYTEARDENTLSYLAVAFTILRRAQFSYLCIPDATANYAYSPWMYAKRSQDYRRTNEVNYSAIYKPIQTIEDYPPTRPKFETAMEVARCTLDHMDEVKSMADRLSFGIMFHNPVATTSAARSYEHVLTYSGSKALSFCALSEKTEGFCPVSARWSPYWYYRGMSIHYYQLTQPKRKSEIQAIYREMNDFLTNRCGIKL